jgi:hypothetical protein
MCAYDLSINKVYYLFFPAHRYRIFRIRRSEVAAEYPIYCRIGHFLLPGLLLKDLGGLQGQLDPKSF